MPNSVIDSTATLKKRGYKILLKLGEGSYSKVYRGEFQPDPSQGPPIQLAVKIIDNRRTREFSTKFLPRELNILCRISHPHIIHIHSILQIGQQYYIFMRFAEQGDLLEYILRNGVIQENQARVWARQIALALQYLHEMNIAHRDLKCENILVTANFNAKLCDFGFARYAVDHNRKPVMSETYCGSLSYCSPEILLGRPYNPIISDMWSFGVVIYVMLNKSMPFDDSSPKALYEKQIKRHFKFRSKVVSILSNEVKTLVQNLLEPDTLKRFNIVYVLSSDWIAMDKRLTVLKPSELVALDYAVQNRLAPPEHLTLPKSILKTSQRSATDVKAPSDTNINIIKSFKREKPRESEVSKMPPTMLSN